MEDKVADKPKNGQPSSSRKEQQQRPRDEHGKRVLALELLVAVLLVLGEKLRLELDVSRLVDT